MMNMIIALALRALSLSIMAGAQPSTVAPTFVTMTPTLSSAPFAPTPKITTAPSLSPTVAPTHSRSSIGSSFVLAFMRNFFRFEDGGRNVVLSITGETAGTGTVRFAGGADSTPFVVTPGDFTFVQLPVDAVSRQSNTVEKTGIRVDATNEIAVYGMHELAFTVGGFLALPTKVLGTNYIVLGYTGPFVADSAASGFIVVAGADDTVITITLSLSLPGRRRREGNPYNIKLDALETYQLFSDDVGEDVTGTVITSTKPVAVFGGGSCVLLPPGTTACDHIKSQLPSTDTWGTTFLTVPVAERTQGDVYRILARESNTDVIIDGFVVATLNATSFFETEFSSFTVHEIVTTKPCLVAQYSKGFSADSQTGDPFQMLIPSIEQFLDSYALAAPIQEIPLNTFSYFINVVVRTNDLDACLLNGAAFSSFFNPNFRPIVIGNSGFSGAQLEINGNVTHLTCPSPFGANFYALAFGAGFGYPGGMALPTRGQ